MLIGKNEILKYLSDSFDIKLLDAAFRNLDDALNPVRFNNFAYVLRELVIRVINRLAPNKKVIAAKWWKPNQDDKIKNKAGRKQQIRYALLDGKPEDFVIHKLAIDIDAMVDYIGMCVDELNSYTHISENYFGCSEKEIPLKVSKACSTITNILGTINQCRDKIEDGIMGMINGELVASLYLNTFDELDILSTHSSVEAYNIHDYRLSCISEDLVTCATTGSVFVRLQYGSDGDLRRGDGMVSSINLPFTAEFTCRLCEDGIIDYKVEQEAISIDTDSFYG